MSKTNFYFQLLQLILLILAKGPGLSSQTRAECDNTGKYVIPNFKSNWFKAMEYCHYLGRKLTMVLNAAEQKEIIDAAEATDKDNGTTLWTGGNDLGDKGNYHWYSTGTRITWFNWVIPEARSSYYSRSDERTGNCIQLQFQKHVEEWKWDTRSCTDLRYFVCERSNEENHTSVESFPDM